MSAKHDNGHYHRGSGDGNLEWRVECYHEARVRAESRLSSTHESNRNPLGDRFLAAILWEAKERLITRRLGIFLSHVVRSGSRVRWGSR